MWNYVFLVLQATMLFVELQYTLATEEAERIGVDHVARVSTAESGEASGGTLVVLLFWSSEIMDCILLTLENRVPLMLFGGGG